MSRLSLILTARIFLVLAAVPAYMMYATAALPGYGLFALGSAVGMLNCLLIAAVCSALSYEWGPLSGNR